MFVAIETPISERSPFIFPAGSDFFKVVSNDSDEADNNKFPTLEQAQKRADALNRAPDEEDVFNIFFDADTHIDYYTATTPVDPDYYDSSEERAAYADN